ncbi:MAG: hypothetical protein AMXMBFR7_43550 [Planctomycetota bacterium]
MATYFSALGPLSYPHTSPFSGGHKSGRSPNDPWKLLVTGGRLEQGEPDGDKDLYDLAEDIAEQKTLAATVPETAKTLTDLLRAEIA